MPDVVDQMVNDNRNIHKWRRVILAIADYSADVPEAFFGTDGKPIALPTGYKNMGFITTDGISHSYDLSVDETNMLQDLEPVRSDNTSKSHTFQVAFGETNGWTKALAYGKPVSEWPSDKNAAWIFDEDPDSGDAYYRAITLAQDGVGAGAVYRVEAAYRIKVTDMDDRAINNSDVEEVNRTFTIYRDPVIGKSYTEAQTAATGVVVSGG
jgi:hypothetical protein